MRKTVRKADHDLLMSACAGDEKSLLVALAAGADPLDAYSSTGRRRWPWRLFMDAMAA